MGYSICGGDEPVTLKKMIQVIEEKVGKKAVIEILQMQARGCGEDLCGYIGSGEGIGVCAKDEV